MTETLAAHFDGARDWRILKVLRFVAGQLLAREGSEGRDVFRGIDVESLMNALQLLAERQSLELAPFVFAWHPTVEELDTPESRGRPRHSSSEIAGKVLRALGLDGRRVGTIQTWDLEKAIDWIRDDEAVIGWPTPSVYETAYKKMTDALVEVLAEPADVSYLSALGGLLQHEPSVYVATLNYDRTFEIMAEQGGLPCSTGVADWSKSGEWHWPSEGFRLLKLHGSIDWASTRSNDDALPQVHVAPAPAGQAVREPAVLFGGHNKLTASGPFLELLAQFEIGLRSAETLLVCGYSFRDPHVNEIITRWINVNRANRIVVVDPSARVSSDRESYRSVLSRGLRGDRGTPERKATNRTPAFPAIPPKPARLKIVPRGARDGLPLGVETALDPTPWDPPSR